MALSAADSTAIGGVQAAYVAAWLADDTAGVLATLDTTAVEGHSRFLVAH
jgi:hypothetical protein